MNKKENILGNNFYKDDDWCKNCIDYNDSSQEKSLKPITLTGGESSSKVYPETPQNYEVSIIDYPVKRLK